MHGHLLHGHLLHGHLQAESGQSCWHDEATCQSGQTQHATREDRLPSAHQRQKRGFCLEIHLTDSHLGLHWGHGLHGRGHLACNASITVNCLSRSALLLVTLQMTSCTCFWRASNSMISCVLTHLYRHLLKCLRRHLGVRHSLGGVSSRHCSELAARVLARHLVDRAEAIPHLHDVAKQDHEDLS